MDKNKIEGSVIIASVCNSGADIEKFEVSNHINNKKDWGVAFKISRNAQVGKEAYCGPRKRDSVLRQN